MGGGPRGNRERYAEQRYFPISQRRKTLDDYDKPTKPRVFISFHVDDEAQVNLLRHQAKTSDQLEFTDYSVKEPFDEKWKTQCTERIRQSTIVVVAFGENTHQREAVDWEIRKAHELGKPVIGMRIYSDKNHKISPAMRENNDRIVPWNLETIQAELDKVQEEK
jgi:DNA-directed RNA polymerase subunit L